MAETARTHARLENESLPGHRFALTGILPDTVHLYVPERALGSAEVRLILHFHGASFIPERAVFESSRPSAVVSVHLGAGSGVYQRAFEDSDVFEDLLRAAADSLGGLGLSARSAAVLTSFSAGYGAVREILRNQPDRIEAVLLLDGLHTDYVPDRKVLDEGGLLDEDQLSMFAVFARRAAEGETQMVITHSEIFPGTFSSTTETADYLLSALDLRRTPVLEWGPRGMQLISEARRGGLVVLGFAGNTAPDHIDHFHGLPDFLGLLD
jgi:hypothetical protein